MRQMRLRYAGVCRLCGASLPAGTEAIYESETKTVRCLECATAAKQTMSPDLEPPGDESLSTDSGVAGSSARREYDRRKAKDEEKLREKWGRLGGLAVALSDERPHTKSWDRGAIGEERLGARLNALAADGLAVLHDRRIPGSKANIDHIAITSGGIWVIDAKRYKGRPELKIEGGILRPRVERLLVGRRDCTKLVDGVLKRVDVMRDLVGDVPVTGVLCFVEADWPLIGGAFSTRGVHVLWPQRLAKVLTEQTAGDVDVATMRESVASRFRSA
ncbi:nuclease-related domain-containing protein [Arthrobacter rhizosphaerae]|uniref:nuclease-related domain-containing protein n=1 Tax=Arthrobacter rhizosphaerae TaxID=2855490 RepID=UPI001FF386CA|nr:nuclease-related domain-containing protein [Arthrobacter rhizosphaerae]